MSQHPVSNLKSQLQSDEVYSFLQQIAKEEISDSTFVKLVTATNFLNILPQVVSLVCEEARSRSDIVKAKVSALTSISDKLLEFHDKGLATFSSDEAKLEFAREVRTVVFEIARMIASMEIPKSRIPWGKIGGVGALAVLGWLLWPEDTTTGNSA